jgi:uncharacterized protein (TIGR02001 family)
MNKLSYLILPLGLASFSSFAAEESPISFNIGLTTDYLVRGISQTEHDPALSGGVDYTADNGLYASFWMSTQSWVTAKTNSNFEFDLSGGYAGQVGDIGYDLGLLYLMFDGDNIPGVATPDGAEVYATVSYKGVALTYNRTISHYSGGWNDVGTDGSRGSTYIELAAERDLGSGWGLIGHVGRVSVKNHSYASFNDWGVGVNKDLGFGVVTLAYNDTNADPSVYVTPDGESTSKAVLTLSFKKVF